jgi:hypothetical protein
MENVKNAVAALFRERSGVTRLARMIGAPVTTVHKWKTSGKIPDWRWPQIEQALRTQDEFKDLNDGAKR